MTDRSQRRVVCAAIRQVDGMLICGPRHFDQIMHAAIAQYSEPDRICWRAAVQGFVDQFGTFMDRREAWRVASAAGQIIHSLPGREGTLFSENLY